MDMIGLGGLLGLLGIWGRSKLNDKIDEVQGDVAKNTEQVENRIKNIEKIATDANRKAQDLSSDNQHFATKIDTEKLSERLKAVENSSGSEKVQALEAKLETMQNRLEEVLQVNATLQQRLDNLEGKHFDESLQKISAGVQNLFDKFHTIADNCKTFDENFKILGTSAQSLDENFKQLDERIKTLEDQPQPSADDEPTQTDRFAAIEEEHKDLSQKLAEYNSVMQKHHVALVQWKNNFVAIQNSFNNIQANFDEHRKIFEALKNQLAAQEKSIDEFKAKIDAQEKVFGDFQAKFDEQGKIIDDFKSKVDSQVGVIDSSKQSIGELEKIVGGIQTKFDEQDKLFDDVKAKVETQDKVIEDCKAKVAAQDGVLDSVQQSIGEFAKMFESLKGKTYLTIENFDIKPTGRIFFTNKPDEVFKNLKIASNLSGITSFLEGSNFEKKENFIRIVENYRQNLKKVSDKLRRHKFNEDALSEEVTDAFFNTLSKFFLATIPISIYRGARQETLESLDEKVHEDEFKFYSTFLTKINEYLAACQVYTVPVLPKNTLTSSDIDRMNVTRKETANADEDNVIDEVERLPYYMDYLTEGGEVETFASEGKMVVLKFDGEAQ